jgi:hypothetical protein
VYFSRLAKKKSDFNRQKNFASKTCDGLFKRFCYSVHKGRLIIKKNPTFFVLFYDFKPK